MMMTTSLPLIENHSPAHICPYDQACSYLEWAAKELKLDQGIVEILSHPRKVITVSIPIKMDTRNTGFCRTPRTTFGYFRTI